MSKTLFIDGQVFQSAAWDRGMGKYSIELVKYLLVDPEYSYQSTYIIFTNQMPLDNEVKQVLKKSAPNVKYLFINLEVPEDPSTADIKKMQSANEMLLNTVLDEYADPQERDYLIMSLFIDQVCSVFPRSNNNILLFYDLIPLQYVERYSKLTSFPNYVKRFKTLFEADIIWSISQTIADDLILNLGLNPQKIYNIDGAPIGRSAHNAIKPDQVYTDNFILMPSGNDLRKNNLKAVRGFEEYIGISGDDVRLVITSRFDDNTKKQLEAYSSRLIFTDNVKESELIWLYQHSKALLFVPEYEGLGLPILEAAESKKLIVCSNIGVFNEISTEAFYYCDQHNIESIGDALARAMNGEGARDKIALYAEILRRYSWPKTAKKALDSLLARPSKLTPTKLNAAVFAPSASGYSDIGKRVLQLHPAMAEYFNIDYYLEKGKTSRSIDRVDYLPVIAQVYSAEEFSKDKYKEYDIVFYHIGNSEYHVETIKDSLYMPGYTIFHDTHLTNIFEGELLTYGYVNEDRVKQEAMLDKTINNKLTSFVTSIVNRQLGIIVHSNYAEEAIRYSLIEASTNPITKVNLPIPTPKLLTNKLDNKQITIGFAGIIHEAKGLDIIELIAGNKEFDNFIIHIFGISLVPDTTIKRLESYPNVIVDVNVTDFEFQTMLRDVDILINYRKDYRGETSAATLEAMRFGVIPIVRKIGWYDELPDDLVLKASSPAEVIEVLRKITQADSAKRYEMSKRAQNYVRDKFNYAAYSEHVFNFVSKHNSNTINDKISQLLKKGSGLKVLLNLIRVRNG